MNMNGPDAWLKSATTGSQWQSGRNGCATQRSPTSCLYVVRAETTLHLLLRIRLSRGPHWLKKITPCGGFLRGSSLSPFLLSKALTYQGKPALLCDSRKQYLKGVQRLSHHSLGWGFLDVMHENNSCFFYWGFHGGESPRIDWFFFFFFFFFFVFLLCLPF